MSSNGREEGEKPRRQAVKAATALELHANFEQIGRTGDPLRGRTTNRPGEQSFPA